MSNTGALAGDTVRLYDGSSTTLTTHVLTNQDITNGYVDLQTGTLTNGTTYQLNATITDTAGNEGNHSTSFTVVEDTTAPNAPSITAIDTDSGTVIDHITNDTPPTVS